MRSRAELDFAGVRVLDGGFATELERAGLRLDGPAWSARALRDAPEAVLAVHRAYLEAGADVILTASYQASALAWAQPEEDCGSTHAHEEAAWALRRSVELAVQARRESGREGALVAASLGPYGAALANGAEFHGKYGFTSPQQQHEALVRFHRERVAVLVETDADLLAFETLPSLAEAAAIAEVLREWPSVAAWCSFTCRDGAQVAHGEPLRACAALLDGSPQVVALGVNCIAPALVAPLLAELRAATGKPLLAYPNSGEGWNAEAHCWTGHADLAAYERQAQVWFAGGAQAVGGCCRTGPEHVRVTKEVASKIELV